MSLRAAETNARTGASSARTELAEKYGAWAVITGASSGIGEEFARQLAVAGLSVVLVARREDKLKALAESLKSTCEVDTKVVVADLVSAGGVETVISACEDLEVGLLVNNAGVELHGSFFHHSMEQHRDCVTLNVTAVTQLAYGFGKKFCEQGRGGILFVSSVCAIGLPWFATYSATKGFVTTLALMLREEFREKNVEVMSLEPGLVASDMTWELKEQNGGEYPGFVLDTEICVKEALQMFGKRAVYTPGVLWSVLKNVFQYLPRPVSIWLLSKYNRSTMDAAHLEPYRSDNSIG